MSDTEREHDGNFTIWAASVSEASHHPQHSPDNLHPERSFIWPTP